MSQGNIFIAFPCFFVCYSIESIKFRTNRKSMPFIWETWATYFKLNSAPVNKGHFLLPVLTTPFSLKVYIYSRQGGCSRPKTCGLLYKEQSNVMRTFLLKGISLTKRAIVFCQSQTGMFKEGCVVVILFGWSQITIFYKKKNKVEGEKNLISVTMTHIRKTSSQSISRDLRPHKVVGWLLEVLKRNRGRLEVLYDRKGFHG